MMLVVVSAAVAIGIFLPHVLYLDRTAPSTAITLWMVSLSLRALTAVTLVASLVLLAPTTALFDAVTHWCWHTILPALATHVGLDGHRIGDTVVALPAVLLAASGVSIAFGVVRTGRAVHRLLIREGLGTGPHGSVIIGGREIVLAAAGFKRPRVVVSVGALAELDDAELAAGFGHERGHIERRHRWLLVVAELLWAAGRFAVPCARQARRQLAFQLERDADRWALRHHDPLALARVICKAAISHATPSPAYGLLSGAGDFTHRVDELVDPAESRRSVGDLALQTAATAGVLLVLGVALATPGALASASAEPGAAGAGAGQLHCT